MATYNAGSASIDITPSLRNFANQLRTQLRGVSAEFDVDVGADLTRFRAQLDAELSRRREVDVVVNLDTGNAEARLDYLSRNRDINLDLQLDPAQLAQIQAQIAALGIGNIGIQLSSASSGMSSLASAAGPALLAVGALAAVSFVPLIASASQALGVLALFPAIATGGVASIATLGIGLSGITGAFSAMGDSAGGAGGAAEDMGHKSAQAAERVEDAKISLQNAEESLADAQNDARDAQNDLNDSYAEGVRQLQDMNDQLDSAQLSTEGAELALVRARERQREVNSEPGSTRTDRWDADLNVREAEERLEQQRRKTNELAADTAKANAEGVEGTDAVISATGRLNDANKSQRDAVQQVRQAQNALTEALYQQANSSSAAAGGVDKYAEAMAKLSPNAQDFVTKVRGLGDAWSDLRKSVQDNMFDGIGDSIVDLADNYFPILKTGLGEIATQFNNGLKRIFDEMSSPRVKDQWSNILNNTAEAVGNLMGVFSNMGRAFTTIASVGSDLLPGLTQGLEDSTGRFADWIDKLADSGRLKEWIQDAIDKFGQLWDIGGKIVELIRNIFSGSKEEGDGMLEGIAETLDRWNEFLGSEEGQKKLSNFFKEVREAMQEIFEIVEATTKLIGGLKSITDKLGLTNKPKGPEGAKDSNDNPMNSGRLKDKDGNTVDSKGNPAFNPGEDDLTSWIPVIPKNTFTEAIEDSARLTTSLGNIPGLFQRIGTTVSEKWTQNIQPALSGFADDVVGVGQAAGRELGQKAVQAWNGLSDASGRVGQFVRERLGELVTGFSELPGRIGGAISGVISGAFQTLQDGATNTKNWVSGRFDDLVNIISGLPARIATAATGMWDGLQASFKNAMNWIIQKWNDLELKLPEITIPNPLPGDNDFKIGGQTLRTPDILPLATGGAVSGPGGPRDDKILAALSNGEYVINAQSTANHLPLIEAINSGRLPKFADGGQVGAARSYADSMSGTGYQMGGFGPGGIDCSGFVSAIVNVLMGLDPYDSRMSTVTEGSWLTAKGFSMGLGGPGDVRIGWWDNGGGANGHTAGTFDDGTNFESGGNSGGALVGGSTGYNDPQFDQHAFFTVVPAAPWEIPGGDYIPGTPGADPGSAGWGSDGYSSGSYGASGQTSWSGVAGAGASAFASGMVSDFLSVLGIPDSMPPAVQAYNQLRDSQYQPSTGTAGVDNTGDANIAQTAPATQSPPATPPPSAPAYNTPEGGIDEGSPGAKDAFWAVWEPLGWVGDQWLDTLRLFDRESGWNEKAQNPVSSAFGIGQFLDTTRAQYPGYGDTAASQAGPVAQYLQDRPDYGNPSAAWALWNSRSPHWYANGGPVVGPGGPTSDSIPAFLSNGEYVVNSMAARQNMPILEAINSGQKVGGGVTNVTNNNVSTARVEDAFWELRNMQDRRAAMAVGRYK